MLSIYFNQVLVLYYVILQASDMGKHKRFYDVDVLEDDVGKILDLPTRFAYKNGAYVNAPAADLSSRNVEGLKFLESVRMQQDPTMEGTKHHVGGAASGALRDLQRMQNNPEYRMNHGDWAVIRNERVPGVEFHPFQVVKIIEVEVNADDVITKLLVHECGGAEPKDAEGPCDVRQTYKPRYKGTDPNDGLEKDLFYDRFKMASWHNPVHAEISPLSVVEWGKAEAMTTTQRRLKHNVLLVISHQPRVEWKLPLKELKAVESKGVSLKRRADAAKKKARAGIDSVDKKGKGAKKRSVPNVIEGPAKKKGRR
jgi:hypothetical protein